GMRSDFTLPICDNTIVDIRASAELIARHPKSVVAPAHLGARVILHADGSADGGVEFDIALRSVLESGVVAEDFHDSVDFSGSWSATGRRLTLADRTFDFATPDANTLILTVDDSVRVSNSDGSSSWEKVQVNLKLSRD
ncbi:MAG: hypothetical protein WD766_13410, partial [Gemmatimonadota bacterium]